MVGASSGDTDGEIGRPCDEPIIELAAPISPVAPGINCGDAYELFQANESLRALPVVADGRPLGLVSRYELFLKLADRFGRPLYEKRPINYVMGATPLVVDGNTSLDTLNRVLLLQHPTALTKGFIVTTDGLYAGVGNATTLLELQVKAMARRQQALEAARERAETASRAKTMMLSNASHELRTPLNAIIGFSDFIISEPLGPVTPPKYREYLADIHSSANHLLDLINDILDMARMESGHFQLAEVPFEPCAFIETVTRMFRHQAEAARLRLECSCACPDARLVADRTALRQVLLNLISNAVKFTPAGGSVRVHGAVTAEGAFRLAVSDTGIGIAEADLERVMQPFGQVRDPAITTKGGTGLGLPIVKNIAEAHGGRLDIDSVPGRGTTVTMTLPAERVHAPAPQAVSEPQTAQAPLNSSWAGPAPSRRYDIAPAAD